VEPRGRSGAGPERSGPERTRAEPAGAERAGAAAQTARRGWPTSRMAGAVSRGLHGDERPRFARTLARSALDPSLAGLPPQPEAGRRRSAHDRSVRSVAKVGAASATGGGGPRRCSGARMGDGVVLNTRGDREKEASPALFSLTDPRSTMAPMCRLRRTCVRWRLAAALRAFRARAFENIARCLETSAGATWRGAIRRVL